MVEGFQSCKVVGGIFSNWTKTLDLTRKFVYTVYIRGKKWEKVERRKNRRSGINGEAEHMFVGQYQHNIDEKGRLTIPSKYREQLETDGAYVIQGLDRNLLVLTQYAFDEVAERTRKMSYTDANARLFKRLLFSTAFHVVVDKAGRILIPDYLRQSAELTDEAFVIGNGTYFEIWSPANWEKQLNQLQDTDANANRFSVFDLTI